MGNDLSGIRRLLLALALTFALLSPGRAHALDRRITAPGGVLLKTSAAGAGAGLVLGLAAKAFFDASWRGAFKLTSVGLYGGIIFGLFVLMAPPETIYGEPEGRGDGPRDGERPLDGDFGGLLKNRHGPSAALGTAAWTPVYLGRF